MTENIDKHQIKQSSDHPIEATLTVWPKQLEMAQPLYVNIKIKANKVLSFKPLLPQESLGEFETKSTDIKQYSDQQFNVYELNYELQTFENKEAVIPTQSVQYQWAGQSEFLQLPSISIPVISSLQASHKDRFFNSEPPMSVGIDWTWLSLVMTLIVALSWRFILRRWRLLRASQHEHLAKKRQVSAELLALQSIKELYHKKYLERKKVKGHYVLLTQIIKTFLSKQFKTNLHDLSSEELLSFLSNKSIDRETLKRVQSLLQDLDHIKYAKYLASNEQHQSIRAVSIDMIQRLKGVH